MYLASIPPWAYLNFQQDKKILAYEIYGVS